MQPEGAAYRVSCSEIWFPGLTTPAPPRASLSPMRKRTAKTVLTAGACLALGVPAVTMWPAQAAGRSSCQAVSPATAPPAQCLVMTNPNASGLAVWGVPGGPAGGTPETEWFDYLGQPIATMGQSGGFKVFGDQVCVYPPGNVFVPDACLRDNGTVTVGGQVLSGADIAWLHAARAAGQAYTLGGTARPAGG